MERNITDKVSDYFIKKSLEYGDLITNLKLQKLLYYTQGWYLAFYDEPLFEEDFEAWVYGPVLVSQYQRFKDYGSGPILFDPDDVNLPQEIKEHLDETLQVFGGFSAFQLALMTHNEKPWKKARKGKQKDVPSNTIISKEDMKEFFKELADVE